MKKQFDLPYITDPQLFQAVKFARRRIAKGEVSEAEAINFAADFYRVKAKTVRSYVELAAKNAAARQDND